jgi:hypothetical protein
VAVNFMLVGSKSTFFPGLTKCRVRDEAPGMIMCCFIRAVARPMLCRHLCLLNFPNTEVIDKLS